MSYIEEFKDHFHRLSESGRFEYIRECNTVAFVKNLKENGVTARQVEAFFAEMCYYQIKNERPLPNGGYMDLTAFARDKKLFSKVSKSSTKG